MNALTIDVEEYFQVSAFEDQIGRDEWDTLPSRVESSTRLLYENGGADRHFDERAKRVVREAGFVTAVTSIPGFVRRASDRFELRRVGIGPSLAELVHDLEWWKWRGGRDV